MSCCAELLGCRHSFQKGGILQAGYCTSNSDFMKPLKRYVLEPWGLTRSGMIVFCHKLQHAALFPAEVEHEGRSVVVFADHFAVPYNHLVRRLSDEKALSSALTKTSNGFLMLFDLFDPCETKRMLEV